MCLDSSFFLFNVYEDQSSLLLTNQQYLEMKQDFLYQVEKVKKGTKKKRKAVVLVRFFVLVVVTIVLF
jgi:hypothetical protein